MTRLKTLLMIIALSLASLSIAQDESRRLDLLEFRVNTLESQTKALNDNSSQILTMTLKLEQLRTDLNEYVASQEKQNNRLWQFLIGPIIVGLVQVWFIPRLVAKQVDNHMSSVVKKE
jgi:hypothetical protein